MKKDFNLDSINASLVLTLSDLNGFLHPLGFVQGPNLDFKDLIFVLHNFMAFASKESPNWGNDPNEEKFIEGTLFIIPEKENIKYEEVLKYLQSFKKDCDTIRTIVIKNFIKEWLNHYHVNIQKVNMGIMKLHHYPKKFDKTTRIGKFVLAMVEVFGINKNLLIFENSPWIKQTNILKENIANEYYLTNKKAGSSYVNEELLKILFLMIDYSHFGKIQVETIIRRENSDVNFHNSLPELLFFLKEKKKFILNLFEIIGLNMEFQIFEINTPIQKLKKGDFEKIFHLGLIKTNKEEKEKTRILNLRFDKDTLKNVKTLI